VANFQPNQSQLSTSDHLSFDEAVDTTHVREFTHKFRKIVGLRIPRKHDFINHG
jgi:hypothetical protein